MSIMPQGIGYILWMAHNQRGSCPNMDLSMKILRNQNRNLSKSFIPTFRKDGKSIKEAESHHTEVKDRLGGNQTYSHPANGLCQICILILLLQLCTNLENGD